MQAISKGTARKGTAPCSYNLLSDRLSDWTAVRCLANSNCFHLSLPSQRDRAPTGYLKAKRPFVPYLLV